MTAVNLSDTYIANMALSRVGSSQIIQNFTDGSNEANQLALWYFADRDSLLTEFPWPFASKYFALSQVSVTGQPANPEWLYSYRYPADCLSVRRIVDGTIVTNAASSGIPATTVSSANQFTNLAWTRQDGNYQPWAFEIGGDVIGRLVYTDCPNAWIKYTYGVQDATQFSPDFADLLGWRVATDLYAFTRSDKLRETIMRKYEMVYGSVRSRFLNEGQNDQPRIDYNSETLRARYGL